jgi:hypothetical protein
MMGGVLIKLPQFWAFEKYEILGTGFYPCFQLETLEMSQTERFIFCPEREIQYKIQMF